MAYGREILILSAIFLVSSLAIDLISPIWSIYIKSSLNASMIELGLVFSVSNGVAAVMQIFSGFLSDKYGRKRIHVLGTLLAVLPPLMYALASDWMDLIPWILLSGFATGLYLPIRWTIVADVSSTKTMASAYGWTNISWPWMVAAGSICSIRTTAVRWPHRSSIATCWPCRFNTPSS